jgi:hypothetical protein
VPVTVHIPIRVRVDADALTASDSGAIDEIGAALAAAAGRALVSSRAVVVDSRGGYLGLCVDEPVFTWTGDRLDRVPRHTRRLLEARLRAVVLRRAEETLIGDRRETPVPEVIPANPAEPIDRRRYWAPAGYYALPSYDRQGKTVLVQTANNNVTPADPPAPEVLDWATVYDLEELLGLIPEVLAERNRQPPQSGLLGFIFLSPDGYLWIHILKFDGGKPEHYWDAPVDLRLPKWDQDKRDVVYVPTPVRPVGTFKLTGRGGAGSGTPAAKQILDQYLRENMLPLLAKTAPVDLAPDQLEAKFAKVSHEIFDEMSRKQQGTIHFAQLSLPMGDQILLVGAPAPTGTIEIIPIAEWVAPRRKGSRRGAGASAGAKSKKGAVDRSILQRAQGGESEAQLLLLGATPDGKGSIYPKSSGFLLGDLSWEPFEGEPSVDDLGEDGKLLRELMERIARRLSIVGWTPYAGRFLINAAIVMGARAYSVQAEAIGADSTPVGGFAAVAGMAARGNFGRFDFAPKPTKAMALYKYILATAPWLHLLYNAVGQVFTSDAHAAQVARVTAGLPHWLGHLREEYRPALVEACGWIFIYACQATMLQLLDASRRSIDRRWEIREPYSRFFYRTIMTQLSEEADLIRLRDALARAIAKAPEGQKVSSTNVSFAEKWETYPVGLNFRLGMQKDFDRQIQIANQLQRTGIYEGAIVYKGDEPAIGDRYGSAWTLTELDLAMQARHSTAMALDPLVNHFLHEHALHDAFRYTPAQTHDALVELLRTMRQKNAETRFETLWKKTYAFEKGRIVEISDVNNPQYIPHTNVAGFDLQGIHLIVWQELAPELGTDQTLDEAIAALFASQLGFASLKHGGEFVGLALLAVLCPPLAELVMAAQAIAGYAEAKELEGFYQSFVDPEQLVSWADVQAELFVAKVTLAITFLPMGGKIVRSYMPRSRALLQRGLKKELFGGIREELRALARRMAAELQANLMAAFVVEMGKNYIIQAALETILTPIIAEVQRQASLPAYRQ